MAANNAVTALTVATHRCDTNMNIADTVLSVVTDVTALSVVTDVTVLSVVTDVTALSVVTDVTVLSVVTDVTVLSVVTDVTALSVVTDVTALSVVTDVTVLSVVTDVTVLSVVTTRYHTSVHSNVTALSLSLSSSLQHRYIPDVLHVMLLRSLSQCYLGHCCHSTLTYTAVTILSLPPMSH